MSKNFFSKALTLTALITIAIFVVCSFTPPLNLNISSVTTQKDNLFQVSDSAKVLATPDTATLQVGVMKEGETVEGVQNELNTVNNALIEALQGVGLKKDEIKTVSFNISPKYRYNPENGKQTIEGYQANASLEVRTTDFDLINKVIDSATKAGANEVGQVNFVVDNRDEYVAQARKEAIDGAKQKGEEIAKEAGISLGHLVDVQVYENSTQPPVYLERAMMDSAKSTEVATSIQPGQNEIEVNVQLFYELQ